MDNPNSQTEVEVTVTPENPPVEIPNPIVEAAEVNAGATETVAETVAESSVQIAEINAARDLALAEANNTLERERLEFSERQAESERAWQTREANLQEQNRIAQSRIAELEAEREQLLTPPVSPETDPNNLTPQSMSDATSETQTEALLESVGEKPGAEAAEVIRRVRRAI